MSNIDHSEVNQPIANLIMLSDNLKYGRSSIEDGNEPSNFHYVGGVDDSSKGYEGRYHDSSIVRDVDITLFPLSSPVDLGLTKVARNECLIGYFIKSFKAVNGRDPNERDVRDHIIFQSYY